MVTDENGTVIRSVKEMRNGQNITIRMADGSADATVSERRKENLL